VADTQPKSQQVQEIENKLVGTISERISYARRGFHRMERDRKKLQQEQIEALIFAAREQGAHEARAGRSR
jgi:hypothetical protein